MYKKLLNSGVHATRYVKRIRQCRYCIHVTTDVRACTLQVTTQRMILQQAFYCLFI